MQTINKTKDELVKEISSIKGVTFVAEKDFLNLRELIEVYAADVLECGLWQERAQIKLNLTYGENNAQSVVVYISNEGVSINGSIFSLSI